MSKVRVLVGTRKGAFILTSDGKREKWDVSGPHFAGWEIFHVKGSPADPNRLYRLAVQWLVWTGHPALERRRQDLGAGGKQICLRRRPRHSPVVRRHAASLGIQAGLASGAVADRSRNRLRRNRRRRPVPLDRRRTELAGTFRPARPRLRTAMAARRRRHVPAHHYSGSQRSPADIHRHLGRRRLPHRRRRQRHGSRSTRASAPNIFPIPTAEVGHCVHRIAMHPSRPRCSSCRSTGTSCAATMPATPGTKSAEICRPTSAS